MPINTTVCDNCSAPLQFEEGQRVVTCSYCRSQAVLSELEKEPANVSNKTQPGESQPNTKPSGQSAIADDEVSTALQILVIFLPVAVVVLGVSANGGGRIPIGAVLITALLLFPLLTAFGLHAHIKNRD